MLRTGDKARVRFRFIKHPEYLRPQQRLVFREGRTKAVGNVIEPITNTVHRPNANQKPQKMHSRGQSMNQNQNQNPNAQREPPTAFTGPPVKMDADLVKNTALPMDGVIEIGVDKRDHHRGRTKRQN